MASRLLDSVLYRTGLLNRLQERWRGDLHEEAKKAARDHKTERAELRTALAETRRATTTVASQLATLTGAIETVTRQQQALAAEMQKLNRLTGKLALVMELNDAQHDIVAQLKTRLDRPAIRAHIRAAVERAEIQRDPLPHLVVDQILPPEVYDIVLAAIPPVPFFPDRDPIKQNYKPGPGLIPTLTKLFWPYFDDVIVQGELAPALVARLDAEMHDYTRHVFGDELAAEAAALPQVASAGRLMLRRPGYDLAPHLDPKRVFLTGLLYLARPGDNSAWGTQLFRIDREFEASYANTYFPERDGLACTLVKTVPFHPNSLLAFVNAGGAHGAQIPADARPADLERYSYQFYVGPPSELLNAVIEKLPSERQARWRHRSDEEPVPAGRA